MPYTEKQISWRRTCLETSENIQENEISSSENDSSSNQNQSAENEPRGADEYTLNVGRGIANLLRWSLIWYFDDLTLELVKLHVVENGSEDENKSDQDIYFKDAINDFYNMSNIKEEQLSKSQSKQVSLLKLPVSNFSTSSISPSDRNTRLYIRWTLEGTPRSSYLTSMFSPRGTRIPRSTFSGIFMYRFDPKSGLVLEHHVKHIIPAPSRRAVLYHGFGGFGGLLWRIRSSMRQQKNDWGIGLGMVGAKTHEPENNKLNSVKLKTSKDKNEFNDHRDVVGL
ncbi:hypothetical protein C1645_736683 [Glomus cerebriforme]|uniref:Uncharacterized protein n=1 Tax=Glomus cerebriforme TaxID=658196 RepID=A0A397T710_9GLOM|nr:hypothetical protein C1645_736683 [Glomus cerebriforme]